MADHPAIEIVLAEKLDEHGRCQLVERSPAGYAKNLFAGARNRGTFDAGRNSMWRGFARYLLSASGWRQRAPVARRCVGTRIGVREAFQTLDDVVDGGLDSRQLCRRYAATRDVVGRKLQTLEDDFIVIGRERPVAKQYPGLLYCVIRVAGERSLVKVFDRSQRGLVAKQHVEKFEPRNVATEDQQAKCQRSGQNEPNWPPYPAPENRSYDDRKWGKASAMAVQQRLDDLTDQQLDDQEKHQRPRSPSTTPD